MKRFRIHNSNVDVEIDAEHGMAALEWFAVAYPDYRTESVLIDVVERDG